MGSLIRLNDARARLFLNYEEAPNAFVFQGMKGHAIGLGCTRAKILTGTRQGELEGPVLKPNNQYLISFGYINPAKYEVAASVHPGLLYKAHLTSVNMYAPGDKYQVNLLMRPFLMIDLSQFAWLLSLYLVD